VLTLDLGHGERFCLHKALTKIDVTSKHFEINHAFLDLFVLHNIALGRASNLQPA
jgi:hypothetical protein